MTSTPNWSDMTDSSVKPAATTTGLGASPSQTNLGDDHIAENSDVFREAIKARNIYAAWARKLTNAKPSDPDLQTYHMPVVSTPPKNQEAEKPAAVPPPPPTLPARVEKGNEASMRSLRHVSVRSQLLAPHTNSCVQASVLVAPFRYCY
ncbi:hypothetical protein TNCV_1136611 [Trichonephila clavipes]|nr:hypothetical protein TNCV_1136611 [Trichonephila clavipes]